MKLKFNIDNIEAFELSCLGTAPLPRKGEYIIYENSKYMIYKMTWSFENSKFEPFIIYDIGNV